MRKRFRISPKLSAEIILQNPILCAEILSQTGWVYDYSLDPEADIGTLTQTAAGVMMCHTQFVMSIYQSNDIRSYFPEYVWEDDVEILALMIVHPEGFVTYDNSEMQIKMAMGETRGRKLFSQYLELCSDIENIETVKIELENHEIHLITHRKPEDGEFTVSRSRLMRSEFMEEIEDDEDDEEESIGGIAEFFSHVADHLREKMASMDAEEEDEDEDEDHVPTHKRGKTNGSSKSNKDNGEKPDPFARFMNDMDLDL